MKFEFRINLKKVIILRTLKIEYPRFIIFFKAEETNKKVDKMQELISRRKNVD